MHKTMFDTPILSPALSLLAKLILKVLGWSVVDNPDKPKKYVLIAAPHTSNWDLPYTLMVGFALRISVFWMGKQEIFDNPLGGLMKWMGGIPVDRSKANNLVSATAEQFKEASSLIITVPPEGTRKKVQRWKSGFYHIAHEAGVPICLGFLDFSTKTGGLGPIFTPSGDFETDLPAIQKFYADKIGRNPEQSQHS